MAFLGLGIFSFISMVSGSVGILGESIKEILIAILGMMAYIFPFIFMLMGTALIVRRPWIFSNKKTYGALLVLLVTAMLLSLNRMEAVHREGFMVTLKNLMNINDIQHGGILGLSMAVPLYRLLGPLGTYIIAGCFYVVAIILIFNTTIYDMLRKSNQARLDAKGKIAVKIEEAQAQKELKKDNPEEKKIQDKLKILEMMNQSEEEPVESKKVETQSPFINLDLEENDGLERVLSKEDDMSREIQILGKNAETPVSELEKATLKSGNNAGMEQKTAKTEERPQITEEKRKADHSDSFEIEGSQIGLDDLEKPLYEFPEIALLKQNIKGMLANEDRNEIIENAKKLEETLMSFGVEARVINVSKGPSVTRYELQPKAGVKVSRIVNLSDDIALALAARGVRIEAPIPGKAAVGIEIPNKETTPVYLREVIEDAKFQKSTKKISVALGKDISGEAIIGDLSKMPHVLIAGATGSGKSVCINSLIISILYKYDPEHVRLLMVDPKVVELNVYNGIPHLLIPVVTDPKKAAGALNWAVNEMTRRYQSFAEHGVRNIEGFNEIAKKKKELQSLPYIVIIVDELADLMMVSANEVEDYIARLAQMARAAGMHLVIATQRPSVDVITGVIKANIPSRISFAVSSAIDSRTILDSGGAEKLLGKGDMLYYPVGEQKPKRIQGAFISEEEVEAIVSRIKVHKDKLAYDEEIINHIEKGKGDSDLGDEGDELYRDAVKVVVENQQASTSFLQRKMRIGYNRAARIMDELEDRGVISERDGSKPRQVLLNEFDLEE
nr:DNA translocase FtsK [Proteiniclasticum aestuarii]